MANAPFVAKRCIPVVSSWIWKLIQGCNGELAVQFSLDGRHVNGRVLRGPPGVIVYYPNAPQAFFEVLLAAPSKGKAVRRLLYKIFAYKLIADPCPPGGCGQQTQCCANAIPNMVHLTIQNVSGCAAINGMSIQLTWNPVSIGWDGVAPGVIFLFKCQGTTWTLNNTNATAGFSCNPLSISFANVNCACGTINGTVTL